MNKWSTNFSHARKTRPTGGSLRAGWRRWEAGLGSRGPVKGEACGEGDNGRSREFEPGADEVGNEGFGAKALGGGKPLEGKNFVGAEAFDMKCAGRSAEFFGDPFGDGVLPCLPFGYGAVASF